MKMGIRKCLIALVVVMSLTLIVACGGAANGPDGNVPTLTPAPPTPVPTDIPTIVPLVLPTPVPPTVKIAASDGGASRFVAVGSEHHLITVPYLQVKPSPGNTLIV